MRQFSADGVLEEERLYPARILDMIPESEKVVCVEAFDKPLVYIREADWRVLHAWGPNEGRDAVEVFDANASTICVYLENGHPYVSSGTIIGWRQVRGGILRWADHGVREIRQRVDRAYARRLEGQAVKVTVA